MNPIVVGIGRGDPVETPRIFSCAKVDNANVDPNAAHPAITGKALGGICVIRVDKAPSEVSIMVTEQKKK
jgi:hypothetical protein